MKRTKTNKKEEPQAPRWKMKDDAGAHYMSNGNEVRPGQTIRAWPSDLVGALDKFSPLDFIPMEPEVLVPKATLIPIHLGDGLWNVIDKNKKPINDKPLTETEAMSLVNGNPVPEKEDENEEIKEPEKENEPTGDVVESDLTIVHKGGGRYNVVDKEGNETLDHLVSREQAEELVTTNQVG